MKIEREFVSESGNIRVEILHCYDGKWKVTWWNGEEVTSERFTDADYVVQLMFELIDQGYKC